MTHSIYEKLNGWPSIVVGVLVLLGAFGYGIYTYQSLEAERASALLELEVARKSTYDLHKIVREREGVINAFQGQIENIAGTVGVLEKLSQTDEELLKKYSKVYFLNENYTPSKLSDIPEERLVSTATNFMIHSDVLPYLEKLLLEASRSEIELLVASAFRSFDTQSSLKSSYKVLYGSGANQFSADQGYSEHQLGTTVDFTTPALGANFNPFASTEAYKWLLDNAHKYGFVLSYPESNSYYKFEPWHWRFVGRDLASDMEDDNRHFYDLDQREIDTYLIKLFD
ncbi:MAG: M15 family metallopeptidase [Candidatus Zambryskibacteria bacterium]|nr:M15 family metallopeptidase [Candidatus Zambryskibacteria bacterium]